MFGGAIFLGGMAGVLRRLPFLTLLQGATVGWAVNGGLAGGLFAVHLMRTLRRRQHGTLTWRWAAVWGAVAGCVPPALGGAMAALAVVQVPDSNSVQPSRSAVHWVPPPRVSRGGWQGARIHAWVPTRSRTC